MARSPQPIPKTRRSYRDTAAVARLRPIIYQRDHWHCVYCGALADVLDHVVPRSRGGETTEENLVAACSDCNTRKGTRLLAEIGWEIRRIDWVAP